MKKYLQKVKDLIPTFCSFGTQQVSKEENTQADALSRLSASTPHDLHVRVFFEVVKKPNISTSTPVLQLDVEPYWIDQMVQYLHDGTLPSNRCDACKLRHQASKLILYEDKLYKRFFPLPLLKCLQPSEVKYALEEVHKRIYGNHLGAGLCPTKFRDKDITSPSCSKMLSTWS